MIYSTVSSVFHRLPFSDRILEQANKVMASTPPPVVPLQINEVTIPASPVQKIRKRILEKRCAECEEAVPITEADDASEATLRDSPTDDLRDPIVAQFLEEQNDEFNVLINRNMDEVIRQQKAFSGESSWFRLFVELSIANSTEEVTQKVSKILKKVGETIPSSVPLIRTSPKPAKSVDLMHDEAKREEAVALLEGLSYESKVALLKQLMVDLGMHAEDQSIDKFLHGSPTMADQTAMEKLEHMSILCVRLWFLAMKHSFPIMKMAYEKFRDNEVFLFNHKNLDASLSVLIRLMAGLEKTFSSPGESQMKVPVQT